MFMQRIVRAIGGTMLAAATALAPAAAFAPDASGQTLTQTDLVLGQRVRFDVNGAAPGAQVFFLVSTIGTGPGACFPAPINLCLDLRGPFSILAALPAGPTGRASFAFELPRNVPLIPIYTQAVVVATTPQVLALKTNTVTSSIQTLSALDDTFDGTALDSAWSILHPGQFTRSVSGGFLHLEPLFSGSTVTWFADGEGPFIHKDVTGDFTVTATVESFDPLNPSNPPLANYRMSGITVRDPVAPSGDRDWLHVAIGGGTPAVPITVEDKNTRQSMSSLVLHPIAESRGDVRVVRRGSLFSLYYRAPNAASFQLLRAHNRPDMPRTVQVGLNIFSWRAPTRVRSRIDEIRFAP